MDGKYLEELRRKLESGDISQELFDEINRRWKTGRTEEPEENKTETPKPKERTGTTNISGSGRFSEVTSEYLKISGSGHVTGNVDVENMTVSGSGNVGGDINVANVLEISGSLRSDGKIEAGTLDSSGSIRARSITAGDLGISGSLKIDDNIQAKNIEVSGSCSAESIEGQDLECSGIVRAGKVKSPMIKITGGIRSDSVESEDFEMAMEGGFDSKIGKLKSGSVKIFSKRRFFRSSVSIHDLQCECADIEYVKAGRITADEVVIGDGCEVDYVEAKIIKTSGNAVIKEKKIL